MNNDKNCREDFKGENIYDTKCPIIYALNIIGQKWKLPIMWYLFENDVTRYNELKRKVKGITNMMLTKSLKELEEYSLITRIQHNTIPPKVEYSLTERGKALFPTLNELSKWGEEQLNLDK
jgi:DNA-binding HxlR family transcriptional regulator